MKRAYVTICNAHIWSDWPWFVALSTSLFIVFLCTYKRFMEHSPLHRMQRVSRSECRKKNECLRVCVKHGINTVFSMIRRVISSSCNFTLYICYVDRVRYKHFPQGIVWYTASSQIMPMVIRFKLPVSLLCLMYVLHERIRIRIRILHSYDSICAPSILVVYYYHLHLLTKRRWNFFTFTAIQEHVEEKRTEFGYRSRPLN